MNTIVEQIDNDVCDIIIQKLDSKPKCNYKLLILNNVDSVFIVNIKNHCFVLNISNNDYTNVKASPYLAKMYKVIKHEHKYFIFYKAVKNKLIEIFKIHLTMDEAENLKNQIEQCMKVYKTTFNKDGYFTLDSLLYTKRQIILYSYVNYPHIKTFEDIIDATFIKIIMLIIPLYTVIAYCIKLDPNFKAEFNKDTKCDMINNSETEENKKVVSKTFYVLLMAWLQRRKQIHSFVKYLNNKKIFDYYYPEFWI